MRRYAVILAVCAAGVMSLCAGCEKQAPAPPVAPPAKAAPAQGKLKIQYEVQPSILLQASSAEVRAPMRVKEDPAASNGKFIVTPAGPDHPKNKGGDAVLKFGVEKEGEYCLWFRAKWVNACSNSFGVMLDGADIGTVEDPVFGSWHWVTLRRVKGRLNSGAHVLVIVNREDDSALDQILLTTDSEYRPTSVEQANVPGRTTGVIATPVTSTTLAAATTTTTVRKP